MEYLRKQINICYINFRLNKILGILRSPGLTLINNAVEVTTVVKMRVKSSRKQTCQWASQITQIYIQLRLTHNTLLCSSYEDIANIPALHTQQYAFEVACWRNKKKIMIVVNITTQTLLAVHTACPDLNKLIKKIYFKPLRK